MSKVTKIRPPTTKTFGPRLSDHTWGQAHITQKCQNLNLTKVVSSALRILSYIWFQILSCFYEWLTAIFKAFDGANHSLNWISSHRPYENLPVDEELTSKAVPPPSISHFPKLKDPGPNVPLSHEDKGEVIERARLQVLKSTDSEMQLAWAEDALYWVEIAAAAAARLQEVPTGDVRPTTPYIEHTIKVDAMNIVSFLAEQYHPKADFMKSMWLESGKFGYRIDRREAFRGFRRSAEKGYSRSEYRMGMQYESANETTKAIEHYGKGLTMGDSAAQHRLGMMYLLGQHGIILQDYQMGIDMIRSAADTADQNAPQGAYVLGMLLAGELPNIDIPEQYLPVEPLPAKLFVEKAAYLGFAKAELRMGQAYEFGQLGCEFDPALSLHYYGLASWQGEAEADMAISKWFLCGYDDVVEKNEELAFIYAKRAAAANVPTALFAMGYFYETGIHVLTDLREAHDWYQKAVDAGAEDAVKHLDAVLREIGRISLIGR
jgi:TPR repeat protein